ncbi:GIN domain-containing protein [Aquimarina spinulae]|uniref:GIN domain-containing protein n=1 Tax=Aquimarina spinulae TaxID=1192023 RepID=UPI000D55D620|nr:DUF2807 domain-containing protein [Aquimarina spinulae]
MKTSNWIVIGALGAVILFFLAFQFSIHDNVRKGELRENAIQYTGNMISETRNVSAFSKISVTHGIEVFFKQDSLAEVKVEASENLMAYIKTEVKHNKLIIEKTKREEKGDTVRIFVSNHQLDSLQVASESYFETKGTVSGKDLILEFTDDSNGNLELSYESVKCSATPGSNVKLKGNTNQIDFSN